MTLIYQNIIILSRIIYFCFTYRTSIVKMWLSHSLPRFSLLQGAVSINTSANLNARVIVAEKPFCQQPRSRRPAGKNAKSQKASNKSTGNLQRLNKAIASAGLASRRGADELVFEGKVSVNGQVVAEPGLQVDLNRDKVAVNGRTIAKAAIPKRFYFALNKPKGFVCSNTSAEGHEGDGRRVIDLFDGWLKKWKAENPRSIRPRLFTVGRLDSQSIGLIFVTNDGDWAQKVGHPSSGLTKEYSVTLSRRPGPLQLQKLAEGCEIDGTLVQPVAIGMDDSDPDKPNRIRVIVAEGRNREVRKLCEAASMEVRVLRRVRIGGYRIPRDLPFGEFKELRPHEVRRITNVGADRSV